MADYLNTLLECSSIPVLTALILGLLTAISPCPLATNVTAVAYISRNIDNRRKVFFQGLLYTFGRAFAYCLLGTLLIYIIRKGADTFELQQFISEWGELIVGPALIAVGLFMLFGHLLHLPKIGFNGNQDSNSYNGLAGSFLLGVLFAMAFCPTSGLFYFGMLIPMSAEASGGYLLPLVFAVATSLPVLIISWFIAFSMHNLSRFIGGVQVFQKWFNHFVAILFICVGCYYSIILLL